ncbi:MAG: transcriptional regulator [Betaproteobacteria bacterium RIFCSPLOWO2_12_FULL_62_13]|nr:MAG: transcriptional regulator [Betaproteobacteria bacterium RIFCSPLOWO2_12_FULL_62_13]
MEKTSEYRVFRHIRKKGILRPKELKPLGVRQETLWRLYRKGKLERLGWGVYGLADRPVTAKHSLAQAAKKVPNGIICLLSALRFHDLTTQAPFEVWMALDRKAWLPRPGPGLAFRFHRFSGEALSAGVEHHVVDGVPVRVYCPAKTVADCFKFRNKIGFDVALEALRDCWRERKASMEELSRYAKICRVANVMRPYLESLV